MPSIGSMTQIAAAPGLREPPSSPRKPSSRKGARQAPATISVLAGAVGLADQILRALAVDVRARAAGEMTGGELSRPRE